MSEDFKMKSILYIGNKLSGSGKSPTTIDTLGPMFEQLGYTLYYSSEKTNMVLRFIDMVYTTFALRRKVDLVCIDTYSHWGFYYALGVAWVCRIFRVPYVNFLHGGSLPCRLDKWPILSRSMFKYGAVNVSPSYFLLNRFNEANYKTCYIPNSIDLGMYSFKLRGPLKPRLLYVRHFDAIYNPQLAIRVLARLVGRYPDAELCMVGGDKDGSMVECKKLAEALGLTPKVTFTGFLSKKEWHCLAADYDVFINTTNIDNMPVSLLEAMALGLPIVTTNAGGIPYLVDDGQDALMVPVNDEIAMETAVLRLLDEFDLAMKLSVNGREKAESFDWDVVKLKWRELIDQI